MSYITTVTSPGIAGVGYPVLPSAKIAPIPATALASGENDVYTVPAGKRAAIGMNIVNLSGGALNLTNQIKVSGTYYQITTLASIANNANSVNAIPFFTFPILEAGESLSVLTSGTGLVLFGYVIHFDNTEPLSSPKFLNLVTGNNTVYTCPSGKLAFITNLQGGQPQIKIFNGTANTRAYNWNVVASGGSPSAANQLEASFNLTTLTGNSIQSTYSSVAAGGFYNVISDGSVAGQIAFIGNLVELPA